MRTVAATQEMLLREALARANGSPSDAARMLGVSRMTVYRWMKRYGLRTVREVREDG